MAHQDKQANENRSQRSPLVWLAVGLAVVLVVVVIVAATFWNRGTKDDDQSSVGDSVTNNSAGDLKITAGMGGTKMGPDGKTPLGYQKTCKGAAEAATNYAKLLEDSSLNLGEDTDKTIDEVVVDHDLAQERKSAVKMDALDQGVSDDQLKTLSKEVYEEFHPEWSGKFLVRDCTPGDHAKVSVTGISVSGNPGGDVTRLYGTSTYSLVWTDNDWKISKDETGQGNDKDPLLEAENGLPELKKAKATEVSYKDGKFSADQVDQDRIVMDQASLQKAFDGVSPDISHWYNYQQAGAGQ